MVGRADVAVPSEWRGRADVARITEPVAILVVLVEVVALRAIVLVVQNVVGIDVIRIERRDDQGIEVTAGGNDREHPRPPQLLR